jgi:hypothetical protein
VLRSALARFAFAVVALLCVAPNAVAAKLSVTAEPTRAPASNQPQPPLQVESSGGCHEPFDAEQANAASRCASWPAPDDDWGPYLDVAGSDAVALRFDHDVRHVQVASTTQFERGLKSPDGMQVPNEDVIAPTDAAFDQQLGVWLVSVPQPLTRRAISGLTFSVVTDTDAGHRSYVLGLKTPRFDSFPEHCGLAYFGSEDSASYCTNPALQGPPPGVAAVHVGRHARLCGKHVTVRVRSPRRQHLVLRVLLRGEPVSRAASRTIARGRHQVRLRLRRGLGNAADSMTLRISRRGTPGRRFHLQLVRRCS